MEAVVVLKILKVDTKIASTWLAFDIFFRYYMDLRLHLRTSCMVYLQPDQNCEGASLDYSILLKVVSVALVVAAASESTA